jgi:HlyD family secretion protein
VSPEPRKWRSNRWLLTAGALSVLVFTGVWWWWAHRIGAHYVTAKVTLGNIRRSVGMTGALNPVVTAQVGSYVSGNIKSWSCDYNTTVKVGQSCALIDPLPFQVVVDEDKADVRTAEAQLVKDRAALVYAKVTIERDSKLLDQGIVSQAQIDTDRSALDQGKAQIQLDIATIASKQASLRAAEVNLAYTNIVSPVNGMVITRYIDVGQTVVSSLQSSTLFLIGKDMTNMQVDTNVSEADVGDVAEGQKAYFTVQAYPNRTFWGTVRQIRRGPITVQNVVTYDVVVDVGNEDHALFPGMTADAHIITAEHANVLRVALPATRFAPEGVGRRLREGGDESDARGVRPDAAPRSGAARPGGADRPAGGPRRTGEGGTPARLWLLVNGKLQQMRVRTGLDDGTLIEVSGPELKAGDEVVVNVVRPNAGPAAVLSEGGQQPRNAQSNRQPGAGPRF